MGDPEVGKPMDLSEYTPAKMATLDLEEQKMIEEERRRQAKQAARKKWSVLRFVLRLKTILHDLRKRKEWYAEMQQEVAREIGNINLEAWPEWKREALTRREPEA